MANGAYSKSYIETKVQSIEHDINVLLHHEADKDYAEYPSNIGSIRAGLKSAMESLAAELDIELNV